MNELLIFTHIPKTSGTSFIREYVYRNVDQDQIYKYKGIKKLMRDSLDDKRVIVGHSKYGIHHFIRHPCAYATILREPLDHAISFYYFILQEYEENQFEHRYLPMAQRYSLIDFWKQTAINNYQSASLNPAWLQRLPGRPFLGAAKKALQQYRFVGLYEQRELFIKQVCDAMNWTYMESDKRYQATRDRPAVSDLSSKERHALETALAKDLALYAYAKTHCLSY